MATGKGERQVEGGEPAPEGFPVGDGRCARVLGRGPSSAVNSQDGVGALHALGFWKDLSASCASRVPGIEVATWAWLGCPTSRQ